MKLVGTRSLTSSWICRTCVGHVHAPRANKPYPSCRRYLSTTNTRNGRYDLPDRPARTRFAPSPTGDLHLGSIRTALFNYLLAKATSGQFILRVEDTDQKRTIPGAEDRLYEDLEWAGLQWDEGPNKGGPYGPYRQSNRIALYQKEVKDLLQRKKAYRCFCSAERLDELNKLRHDKGLTLGYDRKCAHLKDEEADERAQNGESHVVRFRAPDTLPSYVDIVYGKTGHGENRRKAFLVDEPVFDDPILVKTDGFPTYHFANVVDDRMMEITHVIRGSEWMSSTPLHVALYDAFGWKPPTFGHVPLLVDSNHQKLSKRTGNTDIASFRNVGIFPDALVNFAALLGWSHQQKLDTFNLEELCAIFNLKFTKGNTIVSFDKLRFLQEKHAARRVKAGGEPFEQMIRDVAVAVLDKYGAKTVQDFIKGRKLRDVIASMLRTKTSAYRSATDYAEQLSVFFDPLKRSQLDLDDQSVLAQVRIASTLICLTPVERWNQDFLRDSLASIQFLEGDEKQLRGLFHHYLRWALVGGKSGPSIPEILEILGRDLSTDRIKAAALVTRDMETMGEKPRIDGKMSTTRFGNRVAKFET